MSKSDTLNFEDHYHYWIGDSFILSDSLMIPRFSGDILMSNKRETFTLRSGDLIQILDIDTLSVRPDTLFRVLIATDAQHLGWISQNKLQPLLIPNHTISLFVHTFSNSRLIIFLSLLAVALLLVLVQSLRKYRFQMVHVNDIQSFYPTLLCLVVSASAVLYGTVQTFLPDVWREFYFHPTLNPIGGHAVSLTLFLLSLWAMLIVGIAVIDDLRKQPSVVNALSYCTLLGAVCFILYLFFTQTVHLYIAYPLLIVYWIYAITTHRRCNSAPYRCGHCGAAMKDKGECRCCHALNE